MDRDRPPVPLAGDDRAAPLVKLRRLRQRASQDNPLEAVHGLVLQIRHRAERPDLAEADLASTDDHAEVTRPMERRQLAGGHLAPTLLRRRANAQRPIEGMLWRWHTAATSPGQRRLSS